MLGKSSEQRILLLIKQETNCLYTDYNIPWIHGIHAVFPFPCIVINNSYRTRDICWLLNNGILWRTRSSKNRQITNNLLIIFLNQWKVKLKVKFLKLNRDNLFVKNFMNKICKLSNLKFQMTNTKSRRQCSFAGPTRSSPTRRLPSKN